VITRNDFTGQTENVPRSGIGASIPEDKKISPEKFEKIWDVPTPNTARKAGFHRNAINVRVSRDSGG
jgi:hypothetical protein